MHHSPHTTEKIKLYLGRGEFNISQLDILQSLTFFCNETKIDIGIIRDNYFISFENEGEILSEVCTRRELSNSTGTKVKEETLTQLLNDRVTAKFQSFDYNFTCRYENWNEGGELLKNLRAKTNDSDIYKITHEFIDADGLKPTTLTELYLKVGEEICLQTVQTYPDEMQMIFTESKLTVASN